MSNNDQLRDAKTAYIDKYGILHFSYQIPQEKHSRGKYIDITGYKLKSLIGYPKYDEDRESLTVEKANGDIRCREGSNYLKTHPELIEIYNKIEAL